MRETGLYLLLIMATWASRSTLSVKGGLVVVLSHARVPMAIRPVCAAWYLLAASAFVQPLSDLGAAVEAAKSLEEFVLVKTEIAKSYSFRNRSIS